MRLIDADAIQIPKTHADAFENCRNCELLDADQVREIIDSAPTIEPKCGEWKEIKRYWEINQWVYEIECSVCKERIKNPYEPYFCPNCGADMRGKDDETPDLHRRETSCRQKAV